MSQSHKFLFSRDFSDKASVQDEKHKAALEQAEMRGVERGLILAKVDHEEKLVLALENISRMAASLLANEDARNASLVDQAVDLAIIAARKIAGDALNKSPLEPIIFMMKEAFEHIRGVPHLAVCVHETLVDDVEKRLQHIALEKGFEGRLVVIGVPDCNISDVRIEWADGGLVRSKEDIERMISKEM